MARSGRAAGVRASSRISAFAGAACYPERVKTPARVLGLFGVLAWLACGGRAQDSTRIVPEPEPESVEPEPAQSRALSALAEPATRDAFCGWLGSTAAGLAGGAIALDCGEVVSRCREAADSSLMDVPEVQADLLGVSGNLESVLGCPATVGEIDGCVAELIELVVARYPEGPACGAAAPVEPLGLQDLSSLNSCLQVGLKCPELLQQLLTAAR